MPLTPFQKEVLALLASHRNPESHVAGGLVLNRQPDSPRFSADLDIFHDIAASLIASAEKDVGVLAAAGFQTSWLLREPYLQRAQVTHGNDSLRLDWASDSAFRFYPVQPDPEFGYCLHRADLATNKALALAGRSAIRDYIDILYLHESYLSLGAICWAACGKDPGFNPWSLLEMAKRHVHFRQEELDNETLARPLTLVGLKQEWLAAVDQAEILFNQLPAAEAGCLYLAKTGEPRAPDPTSPEFATDIRHFGSVRGAWPTIVGA
jgi:hypothetical protein